MPDHSKPFQIETDASKYATGAVLTQLDSNGDHHPVAFILKTLSAAERNYHTHNRNLLAIVRGIRGVATLHSRITTYDNDILRPPKFYILQEPSVLLLLPFPISFCFIHNLFHWCAVHVIICYCLLYYINNPESKYSTFQLLTSDSRYSYYLVYSIHQLLTSDSSCLITCHSLSQLRSSVHLRRIDLPRNRLWAPASRRFAIIIFSYNV